MDVLLKNLNFMKSINILICLLSFLLSNVFTYFYSLRNYQPIKTMMNIISKYNEGKDISDITFSKKELSDFGNLSSFGMPMADIQTWLKEQDSKKKEQLQTGIPMDSIDNQLSYWVRYARLANPNAEVAIKGDGNTEYAVVKKIMDLLQDNKVNKFNLVTNLEKQEIKLSDIPK